jgi:DNA-binding GntR family transcriptional regulator
LVLELRKEFEPLVASRAARRATVDERHYLSKIANSFMEAGATVDVMKFLRAHFETGDIGSMLDRSIGPG